MFLYILCYTIYLPENEIANNGNKLGVISVERMKKQLIIADVRSNNNQGQCTGHFIAVAKMYKDLFRNDFDVIIAGGPIYLKYFDKSELLLLPCDVQAIGQNPLYSKINILRNCWALFQHVDNDAIIIIQQSSDVSSHLFSSFFHWGGNSLFLIRYSTSGISSVLKKCIYSLIKKRVSGVICPNEMVGKEYGVEYCIVPDYIYCNHFHEESLICQNKKYDFCLIGRLNNDKGVIEVAEHFTQLNRTIIIAGKPDNKEIESRLIEISNKNSNIILKLGYLSDTDFDLYIRESKYCILNYQGEYSIRSSGVVFDTIFRNTPVVGRKCKALVFVEENRLGYLFNKLSEIEGEDLFDRSRYLHYINCISSYKKMHNDYRDKLLTFITR